MSEKAAQELLKIFLWGNEARRNLDEYTLRLTLVHGHLMTKLIHDVNSLDNYMKLTHKLFVGHAYGLQY